MCFNVSAQLKSQLRRAIRKQDQQMIEAIIAKMKKNGLEDLYQQSGFNHPAVLIYTRENPDNPVMAWWGLVPEHTINSIAQKKIWNSTLNARGEDMFDTYSFKKPARTKRCLFCVDGFFEHYHFKGKTYPYYIHRADNEPMTLAGLWAEWTDKETGQTLKTFTIITTKANELMAKIHNNPNAVEPRMPLILPDDAIDDWLIGDVTNDTEKQRILSLVRPYNAEELEAYTVPRLMGKTGVGNSPDALKKKNYPELLQNDAKKWTLF